MSRGLSSQQRQLLATLVVAKRPLDATRELGPLVGMPATDSGRRSLLRAVRLLAKRGLVTITREPGRQGWPAVMVEATPGAVGELRAPDWQRASTNVVRQERKTERALAKKRTKVGRGKSWPLLPAGVGLDTSVENLSRYPDSEVFPLVEFATEGVDMRGVHVRVKNSTRRVSGRAYPDVSHEIFSVPAGTLYLITVKIGPPKKFPTVEHRYGWKQPGPRNQFPMISYADWREALVAVAAHEAMHIEQFKQGRPRSELETSRFEADALERYRSRGNG